MSSLRFSIVITSPPEVRGNFKSKRTAEKASEIFLRLANEFEGLTFNLIQEPTANLDKYRRVHTRELRKYAKKEMRPAFYIKVLEPDFSERKIGPFPDLYKAKRSLSDLTEVGCPAEIFEGAARDYSDNFWVVNCAAGLRFVLSEFRTRPRPSGGPLRQRDLPDENAAARVIKFRGSGR
jgi:hypothetical protein